MSEAPPPAAEEPSDDTGLPLNRKALASVGLGVAGFLCLFVFPFGAFVLGIPAITTGIHARREIVGARGTQGGDNLAVCGLIIGGAGLVFGIIALGLAALPHS